MSRKPLVVTAGNEVKEQLQNIVNRRKSEQRLVERAHGAICGCSERINVKRRAVDLALFDKRLFDMPRSGRTASYTKQDEQRVIDQISQEPPDGLSRWDGTTLARELGYSDDFVWRVMRKNNLHLNRSRS